MVDEIVSCWRARNSRTGAKQDTLSTNPGAVLFTIKVEVYLLFVERENTGEEVEWCAAASGGGYPRSNSLTF